MDRSGPMSSRLTALARCDASDTPGRHGLYGYCVVCGETAHDWRALIGIGARLATCAADPATALLTYPGACAHCGGSELAVCALSARALRAMARSTFDLGARLGYGLIETAGARLASC